MKAMKKILAVLLTLTLVAALIPAAFADTVTSTITVPDDGHTYVAYQIFKGTLENGKLCNLVWGANGTGTENQAVTENQQKTLTDAAADPDATDADIVALVSGYLDSTSTPTTLSVGSNTVDTGYYVIKDETIGSTATDKTYSLNVIKVAGNVTIVRKSSVPSMTKKAKDITNGTESSWQDSGDWAVGQDVPFQLLATLGDELDVYTHYYVQFVDHDMAQGLSFNDDVTVKLDGNDVTANFPVETTSDGFTATCNDVIALGAQSGSTIELLYSAKLTGENVVYGRPGNPNTAKLVFSNNPSWNGEGTPTTSETPDDTVVVFTYKVVVNKVNGDETDANTGKHPALEGAGFTLYKNSVADANKIGTEIKDVTTFSWSGLDDGTYVLDETTVPNGFNKVKPITFTITAEHTISFDSYTGNELTVLNGNVTTGEITFTPALDGGTLTTDVENKSGAVLPTTGGIGTTLFYVFGSILVIGAGVLLVTKKRMGAAE